MSYAADHAGALVDVAEAGAAVTFSRVTQGSYDPETGTSTPSTTTVTGSATQVTSPADLQRFLALGLTAGKAMRLMFVPATYGDVPEAGDTVEWGGETYTVRDVEPLSPDGTAILSYVTVER